jgi:hypothetical protein
MTRLEQAKRWWRNNEGRPVPPRHVFELERAGLVTLNDPDQTYEVTDEGKAVFGG